MNISQTANSKQQTANGKQNKLTSKQKLDSFLFTLGKKGFYMATLKDVADKAGVTITTVSRVINNRGYISEQTRQKVFDVMKELSYQPNEVARSLSKQRTNTIGIIVPHIMHPYFAKLISNLEMAASKRKFKILLCNSKEQSEKEIEYIDMCKSNRVSGIVLCSRTVDMKKMKDLEIPLVTIERFLEGGTAGIECDNYMGGKLATEHLIQLGCRKLLHFSGIAGAGMPADARAEAFIKVCEEYELEHIEVQNDISLYNTMEYHAYIKDTFQHYSKIDGVFASSDLIAAQVIQVCSELSISIPGDLKVVGFDDVNIAQLTTPTITTIRQPIAEMADMAIELIEKSLKNEVVPTAVKLPVTLVKRDST